MELKWIYKAFLFLVSFNRSNRTFMELKLSSQPSGVSSNSSSNRTFMELKYGLELVEIAEGVF